MSPFTSDGIVSGNYVFINAYTATIVAGEVVMEEGRLTGARPGQFYRSGQKVLQAAE